MTPSELSLTNKTIFVILGISFRLPPVLQLSFPIKQSTIGVKSVGQLMTHYKPRQCIVHDNRSIRREAKALQICSRHHDTVIPTGRQVVGIIVRHWIWALTEFLPIDWWIGAIPFFSQFSAKKFHPQQICPHRVREMFLWIKILQIRVVFLKFRSVENFHRIGNDTPHVCQFFPSQGHFVMYCTKMRTKGLASFTFTVKLWKSWELLAVLGIREQPNLTHNLGTPRHW